MKQLEKRLNELSTSAIDKMNDAIKASNSDEEVFHRGAYDLYNLVKLYVAKGSTRKVLIQLASSLKLESKARHSEADTPAGYHYEEGRLSAAVEAERLIQEWA